jgi:predicted metal-dependent peptidase
MVLEKLYRKPNARRQKRHAMSQTESNAVVPAPPADASSVDRTLSATLLRLRVKQPFFGALALFARYEVSQRVPTAATDGRTIFVNPDFWNPLTSAEQDGLLLHELLHAALGHCWRCGVRDQRVWNIAADIVINGMICEDPQAALPKGGMRDLRLEKFGVEEVYELLQRDFAKLPPLTLADLMMSPPGQDNSSDNNTSLDTMRRTALAGHWQHALEQAAAIARSQGGDAPGALKRELEALNPARLDWRAVLWRYLVRTPSDFSGWDRRHLSRGLYLEQLEGESVRVWVCVDTSGSVRGEQLASFLSEVQGVLRAYPHVVCDLYFADAKLHGPTRLTASGELPAPVGGGGTDFCPFFTELESVATKDASEGVAIYLTDGHGRFPAKPPRLPVLWVVVPGGLPLEKFPFGETVRMVA